MPISKQVIARVDTFNQARPPRQTIWHDSLLRLVHGELPTFVMIL